jgi:lipoate-protein ligase A
VNFFFLHVYCVIRYFSNLTKKLGRIKTEPYTQRQRNQRNCKMKLLDLTLLSTAENLACDEALLDAAEAGTGDEVLRFWEPREHFVVVGYANKVATEVNVAACETRGIPILRRCSGGGTVAHPAASTTRWFCALPQTARSTTSASPTSSSCAKTAPRWNRL